MVLIIIIVITSTTFTFIEGVKNFSRHFYIILFNSQQPS